VAQKSRDLHEKLIFLSERSGLPLDESPEGRVNLLRIARRSVDLPEPLRRLVHARRGRAAGRAALRSAGALVAAQQEGGDLFSAFHESILELDHAPLRESLAQQKGGLLGLLNPSATRAANAVKACAKAGVGVKDRDLGKDLDAAAEVKELRRWGAANADRLQNAFGSYYRGAATDWI
jgi:hypothetical protein